MIVGSVLTCETGRDLSTYYLRLAVLDMMVKPASSASGKSFVKCCTSFVYVKSQIRSIHAMLSELRQSSAEPSIEALTDVPTLARLAGVTMSFAGLSYLNLKTNV